MIIKMRHDFYHLLKLKSTYAPWHSWYCDRYFEHLVPLKPHSSRMTGIHLTSCYPQLPCYFPSLTTSSFINFPSHKSIPLISIYILIFFLKYFKFIFSFSMTKMNFFLCRILKIEKFFRIFFIKTLLFKKTL